MTGISNIAREVTNSPIRRMFNIASTMSDVINFTVGEPDFVTPKNIIDAAVRSLRDGQTKYTLNAGIPPLRKAIQKRMKENYSMDVDPDKEIIVTAGGMEALFLCMMVLINPGDEVIISDPHWSNYPRQVQMCGGIPRFVKVYEEDGFIYNVDHVKKAVNKKTKAIIINSPANPTGGVADRETLKEIAKIAVENDLIVISDEVYQHFLYEGAEFVSISTFEGMKERTVIIDSFSKTYAMTGWRVGYAVGPEEVIKNMVKYQENVIGCVNSSAQFAAIEALEGTQEPLKHMIDRYTERRKIMVEGINHIEKLSCIRPKGAFYAFVNISGSKMGSEEFAVRLLKSTGVVVVPGSGFGEAGEGYVRLSYATSEENISEGLKRMEEFMKSLR
ncbi:MAG: pyridoxal phosphate-dependent aminotransferase [Clostridiales bacterium]|jgi:aminotransferase|nr:pyridoxal phosphate-dependent aminotransferase [Eubacteriales bacterium]MDH7567154.1 pyridoxal phosphate-dependent aminotransferase [Clostridiales bacterium]